MGKTFDGISRGCCAGSIEQVIGGGARTVIHYGVRVGVVLWRDVTTPAGLQ